MNEKDKQYIYILKAIAIFFVICAHVANIDSQNRIIHLMAIILENMGSLGIGIFYFFAGYFFTTQKSFLQFMNDKLKNILIPWLFTGVVIYLYVNIRKGDINFKELLLWLVGYKTYLYFLTNLLFFYCFYFLFTTKKIVILSSFLFGIISLNLTAFGFLNEINPYLNPFNFIIYFSIGKLINEKSKFQKMKEIGYRYRYLFAYIYIIIAVASDLLNISAGYFGKITLILQISSLMMFIGFGQNIKFKKNYIIDIGRKSYSIYLLHMPVAGIITYIFNRYLVLEYFIFLRPFIVLFLTYQIINLVIYLERFGIKIDYLIGVKKSLKKGINL